MQNPEKKEAVKEARLILKSLQFEEGKLSDEESSFLLKRIKETNALREEKGPKEAIVRTLNDHHVSQRRRKAPVGYLLRYAAILGGAVILALSLNLLSGGFINEPGVQYVEVVNKKGQKARK